jgi:hypothetical protein
VLDECIGDLSLTEIQAQPFASEKHASLCRFMMFITMNFSDPLAVASIGGLITLTGYFISNGLERSRTIRIREMEFKLAQYKEFLAALTEQHGKYTYETHVRFVNSMNAILLIAEARLLYDVKDLVDNYNDAEGTDDRSWEIINRIIYSMRCDLGAKDAKKLAGFEFPIIVPDLERLRENEEEQADNGPVSDVH